MGNASSSGALIGEGIAAGVGATLMLVALFFYLLSSGKYPDKFPTSLGYLFVIPKFLVNILPISFFIYGFVADMFKGEFKSSLPSVIALGCISLFKLADTFSSSGTAALPSGASLNDSGVWCTLPGLEFLENPWIPTSLFTFSLIIFYYALMAWETPSTGTLNLYLWGIGAVGSAAIMTMNTQAGCSNYYVWTFSSLLSLLLGAGLGSLSAWLVATTNPSLNPFLTSSGSGDRGIAGTGSTSWDPTQPATGKVTCPPNQVYLPATGTCVKTPQSSPPTGDEQTFVAELYKNGQLISTESIGK